MGSRIMHLAISDSLLKQMPRLDRNRFLIGSVLPDAAAEGNSHRKVTLRDGKRTYDLSGFRAQYLERMKSDPLYTGFYLHLVQDLVFRQIVYGDRHWDPRPPGNVERLHNDYRILNRYIIQAYRLSSDLEIPPQIEAEPLVREDDYRIGGFFQELRSDFDAAADGTIFFFQKELADEYLEKAIRTCRSELAAIRTGGGYIDETALAWI